MKRVVLALLVMLSMVPAPVRGQDARVVQGRVIDARTMAPVANAYVGQTESPRGVVTDSMGLFLLSLEADLAPLIRVVQMGYAVLQTAVPEGGEGRLLNVLLVPDPVQIDGLTVLTERLADRRRGPYGIGEVLLREQLLTESGGSGIDLVRRTLPFVQPCGPETEALCMGGRSGMSGPREVTVCLDGNKLPSEVIETMLGTVDPRGLYMVEIYSRVGEVRMYSPSYMQRLIEAGSDLPPLTFGCNDAGM